MGSAKQNVFKCPQKYLRNVQESAMEKKMRNSSQGKVTDVVSNSRLTELLSTLIERQMDREKGREADREEGSLLCLF